MFWGGDQRVGVEWSSESLKVAVPQVRGLVPLLPSQLGTDWELGFHLSSSQQPSLQDNFSNCYMGMWSFWSKGWGPKAEWGLVP